MRPRKKLAWQWHPVRAVADAGADTQAALVFATLLFWAISTVVVIFIPPCIGPLPPARSPHHPPHNDHPVWTHLRVEAFIAAQWPWILLGLAAIKELLRWLRYHPPIQLVEDLHHKAELERLAQLGRDYEEGKL